MRRRQVKKRVKKVVSFFMGKIGVTPSVATPGDTNLSDATGGSGVTNMADNVSYWRPYLVVSCLQELLLSASAAPVSIIS